MRPQASCPMRAAAQHHQQANLAPSINQCQTRPNMRAPFPRRAARQRMRPTHGCLRARGLPPRHWREAAAATIAREAARQLRTAGAVDLARVLRCIPTGRTADVDAFSLHCRRKLAAFAAGRRLYGVLPRRHARLRKQLARTRHFHRLAQMLAWGASSVRGRWNRAPRPVADKPELAIIGWGAASAGFDGPISRKGLGPSRAFEHFVRSHYHPSVCFVRCNEFHMSQVCTLCWALRPKRPAAHFEVGGSLCYKLL
ncbi:MAG: hypothetical protein J3K34DRAFT_422322, partial [Monoraphidium minutum]